MFGWFTRPKPERFNSLAFVVAACDRITLDLDWDTVNAGALDYCTDAVRTIDGAPVIIGVIDCPDKLAAVVEDSGVLRSEQPEWESAPLWLYAPPSLDLSGYSGIVHRAVDPSLRADIERPPTHHTYSG